MSEQNWLICPNQVRSGGLKLSGTSEWRLQQGSSGAAGPGHRGTDMAQEFEEFGMGVSETTHREAKIKYLIKQFDIPVTVIED